ncbi:hypothetical protein JAAARDRAFT_194870 [Jaapia argillacea MUCL 33604]|uniref:CxC2-like cysteine cluster KDZ transposase-associated domain-containing protein n=1 Tax=Jaapia argillacea MUCL 33604 TaxID=933084 RepID=A0A067PSX6_9AGAM|nr:hypothetical protein JAAARDRAFT_194870 [Jaapia argillacea MUCL 33604]
MTIVDLLGVHELTVNLCQCPSKPEDTVQLLDMGLYPASVVRPSSTFTFNVLDDFTRHNLEYKTNAHEYYETMRRATRPDRYQELLRCSWQWRHLKMMKWNGFGYGPSRQPETGEMALFCPACPQKDVNLMEGWMEEARDMPWLYACQLNLDGNFKAEQTRRKYPEDDTPIAEGSGYLCSEASYKEYLGLAKDTPQKATCHNHKAQSQANSATKHLAVTGIVAAACARHGCFCPGSCANLQFGERQVNMNYILAQALRLTKVPGVCPSIVLYDIICQYGVYVERRFGKLPQLLDIRGALDILKGIGLFHVNGEIIETLWAGLNQIAASCHAMGNGHRAETLDFHMLNSNWQKLLGIVASVIKKYRRACKQVPISATAFQEMDVIASSQQREAWIATYDKAMRTRQTNVEAMDVFAPSIKKAATKSELQQSLSCKEGGPGPIRGTASWLLNGIAIQEAQVELGAAVRKMGWHPTADDLNQIDDRRRHLNARIDTWQKSSECFLVQDLMVPEAADPSGDDPMIISDGDAGLDVGEEYDNVFNPDEDGLWEDDYNYDAIQAQVDQSNGPVDAEKRLIALPSTLGASQCCRRG